MYLFENEYEKIQNAYREEMKEFFPTMHNFIKHFTMQFSSEEMNKTKIFHSENSFLKKYIKNLDIEVRISLTPRARYNSFPWNEDLENKNMQIQFFDLDLFNGILNKGNIIERAKKLSNPQVNGDKIIFPPSDIKILMFESKGLIPLLETERQRVAVVLSEIGIWAADLKYVIQMGAGYMVGGISSSLGMIIKNLYPFLGTPSWPNLYIMSFPIYALSFVAYLLMMTAIRARQDEADQYVKKLGYGNDYIEILEITKLKSRTDVTMLLSMVDKIVIFFDRIQQILPSYLNILFPAGSTIKSRIEKLKDNDLLFPFSNPYKQILEEDELILSSRDQAKLQILRKKAIIICNQVDKMFSGNRINLVLPQM